MKLDATGALYLSAAMQSLVMVILCLCTLNLDYCQNNLYYFPRVYCHGEIPVIKNAFDDLKNGACLNHRPHTQMVTQ